MSLQAGFPHQACDTFASHPNTRLLQRRVDARAAMVVAGGEDGLNPYHQALIVAVVERDNDAAKSRSQLDSRRSGYTEPSPRNGPAPHR